jgi:uncharacterized protein (DUF1800 family)
MAANNSTRLAADIWARYEPTKEAPWNRQRAVHLHRRAGFAATWAEIERDLAGAPQQAVDRVLGLRSAGGPPAIAKAGDSALDSAGGPPAATDFESMARTIGDAAVASGNPNRLKAWWLYRMLFSPDPLGERLTLMWHNHFATSNRKVQDLALMREQNDLLRRHARSTFGELLQAVVKHPAMLVWLDADANRKGHPNENLARELLELFTLGVGRYTEQDVQQAARALTGWAVVGSRFGFREARHDGGEKVFLTHRGQLDGNQLLEQLVEHEATADRIAGRICGLFFGESAIGAAEREALADGLRENNFDVGWAVETVLRSQLFFADANLRSRVAGPVEWLVGAVTALELTIPPPSTLLLAEWTTRTGQDLFYPPNVGGWTEGRAWLNSQGVLARANFAAALVAGNVWHPQQTPDLWQLVERHRPTKDLAEAVRMFAELLWGSAPRQAVREVAAAVKNDDEDRRLTCAVALLLSRPESQVM